MKKLNIPSAMVGLMFGLIATAFVYLFVPPPSTASADYCDCPSIYQIQSAVASNCASSDEVADVGSKVRKYCYLWHN